MRSGSFILIVLKVGPSLPSFLQVTYRLVQVTDQSVEGRDDGGGAVNVVSSAAFSAPQAVAQVRERPNLINNRLHFYYR